MNRHNLIAFAVVIIMAAGSAYLLTSIDRHADEEIVVPKANFSEASPPTNAVALPPAGPDSIFKEPQPQPLPESKPQLAEIPDGCEILLTLPPKERC